MIDDTLLGKFARIQELPVSEEMLGAYVEGGLHNDEFLAVSNSIASSDGMGGLVSTVQDDLDSDMLTGRDNTALDGIVDWAGLELPETASEDACGVEMLCPTLSSELGHDDVLSPDMTGDDCFGEYDNSFDDDFLSLDAEDYNFF